MLTRNNVVYFTEDELKCKGSGLLRLAPGFGEHLIDLRIAFGKPMKPISCCRSIEHNAKEGGKEGSFHICDNLATPGCCAIDIATPDPQYRTELIELALGKGWSVGIKKTMVHLDLRSVIHGHKKVIFVY